MAHAVSQVEWLIGQGSSSDRVHNAVGWEGPLGGQGARTVQGLPAAGVEVVSLQGLIVGARVGHAAHAVHLAVHVCGGAVGSGCLHGRHRPPPALPWIPHLHRRLRTANPQIDSIASGRSDKTDDFAGLIADMHCTKYCRGLA